MANGFQKANLNLSRYQLSKSLSPVYSYSRVIWQVSCLPSRKSNSLHTALFFIVLGLTPDLLTDPPLFPLFPLTVSVQGICPLFLATLDPGRQAIVVYWVVGFASFYNTRDNQTSVGLHNPAWVTSRGFEPAITGMRVQPPGR